MQAMPLQAKIRMSKRRISEWYEHFGGSVYLSFSGGIDSTVLKHIIDSMYDDVPAVFVNTGLEYPEIQHFVREVKAGKYDCFNSNVDIIRPEMRFDQVIETYGYPIGSKETAYKIERYRNGAEWAKKYIDRTATYDGKQSRYVVAKRFLPLCNAPFKVSPKCCDIMKKRPAKHYEKQTNRKPYIGTMADESLIRAQAWQRTGCNTFEGNRKSSKPLSFWTRQDVLEYITLYNVPYCKIYGTIQEEGQLEGQYFIDGFHAKLSTSGVDRTGCIFCMFGCHLEPSDGMNEDREITDWTRLNRFQRLSVTHPKQYDYCINKLGLGKVLDYIGVKY